MSSQPNIDVIPVPVVPMLPVVERVIDQICRWSFEDSFVPRLLNGDVKSRVRRGRGAIWLYRDANKEIVEFGTIDVCWDYGYVTGGRPHPHIPLLAVKPDMRGKGIGPSIITHLIGEAVLRTHWPAINCYPAVFLEVYTDNLAAMRLYEKTGFEKLSEEPSYDPDEKKHYFVMVKSLSIVPEQGIA